MLHGGNDELAAVTALLQRTRAGDGGGVVLRGAEGVGKTTLLAEALWAAKGMTVLRTAGPRGGGALPYTALRQLLATLHPKIGRLPHTRAQALRIALGLAPGAADRVVVAAAACALVTFAAREQPVLIVVDDAHWLDAASASVVGHLAARAEGLPIAVLRATRERVGGRAGTSSASGTSGVSGTSGASGTSAASAASGAAGASGTSAASGASGAAGASGTSAASGASGGSAVSTAPSDDVAGRVAAKAQGARRDAAAGIGGVDGEGDVVAATAGGATVVGAESGSPVSAFAAPEAEVTVTARTEADSATAESVSAASADVDAASPSVSSPDSFSRSSFGHARGDLAPAGAGADPRGTDRFGDDTAGAQDEGTRARRAARTAWRPADGVGTRDAVATLPEDARRLLALAALEPAADLDQLAVAGRRVGVGRAAHIAVRRAGLVEAAEHRVRFPDAAMREEVRRSLSAAERRTLHGALAFAASGALAYRRAWHLAALATGPDADLAEALEAGAGRTRRELGAGAAAATWEQAARLTADRPAACRRYVSAAYAAWEAGFPARARTLLDTADAVEADLSPEDALATAASGTAIRLRAALRHAEGHRSEAGALLLDAARGRAALLLAATGAAWEAGDRERTMAARNALAELPLADDDPLRTVVAALGSDGVSPAMVAPATRARLYGLGIALWEVTPLAVHAAATDEAAYEVLLDEAAVLRTHGARGALAAALMPLAVAGALSGRAVEAETHAAEGLRLARSTGQGTLAAWFLAAMSMAATTQGRVAEARDGAWQALRLTGTMGLTPVAAYALYALAVVERAEGRTDAACELLAKALAAPAGALLEVRIRAELATAGPNRSGVAALPPRNPLPLPSRITRTPQLAAGTA